MNSPATRHSIAGFNLIESLVVLATIGVLVFITIPVLKVYVFDSKTGGAPIYIEKRGTDESPAPDGANRFENTEAPEPSSTK